MQAKRAFYEDQEVQKMEYIEYGLEIAEAIEEYYEKEND